MAEKINLREMEKRSFRSFFQDGMQDVGFGVLLLCFALAPVVRDMYGYAYIILLVVPGPLVITLGRKYITQPRMGVAKFNEKRKTERKRIAKISAVSTLTLLALLSLTLLGIFPGPTVRAIGGAGFMAAIGVAVVALMGYIAYLLDFKNMLYYGFIIGFGIVASEILHGVVGAPLDSLIVFGTSGTLLLAYGIVSVLRFLKDNPKQAV